jgi:hypothetical protein
MGAFKGLATALLAGTALASTGCAVAPPPYRRSIEPTVRAAEGRQALFDYRGLIHVHSNHSKDSTGTLDNILGAAENAGADFLIITDHSNMNAQPWEGMHGNMLIVVGTEYSKSQGHMLGIGQQEYLTSKKDTAELMDHIERQGGFSVVAHPYRMLSTWKRWDLSDRITHIEVHNLATDIIDNIPEALLNLPQYAVNSYGAMRALLDRPSDEIRKWDELNARQKVVGLGSVDAHQKWYTSYGPTMKLVSTHILAPSLTRESVIAALKHGRCYVAFEPWGETTGFNFTAENGAGRHGMGDTLTLDGRTVLRTQVPQPCRLDLYHDGLRIQSLEADRPIAIPITKPGVYRIEAFRDNELWILSNPIYVK